MLATGIYVDDGTFRGYDRRAIQVVDESQDFSNKSRFFLALGILSPRSERLRVGALVRYYGSYDYELSEQDRKGELGQLFELVALAEWRLPMTQKLDLLLGANAGLALLLPGGTFEQEIRNLQAQGASVWNVPRLGYVVGPQASVRHHIADRVSVRVDFGADWTQTFLFFTKESVGGVAFEKSRRANVIRFRLGVSLEVSL